MENILEQYSGDQSAVIQALQDTQKAYGYISQEHLKRISENVGTPYSYTYAIATFYKSFSLWERGKYIIKVCDGTACHLELSGDIVDEIHQYLEIGIDETTEDRLFTLEQVNCLGACAMAPVLSINETLYGKLTRKKVRAILDRLKESPPSAIRTHVPPATEPVRQPEQPSAVSGGKRTIPVFYRFLKTVKNALDKLSKTIDNMLKEK